MLNNIKENMKNTEEGKKIFEKKEPNFQKLKKYNIQVKNSLYKINRD